MFDLLKIIILSFFSNPKLFLLRVFSSGRHEEIHPKEIFDLDSNLKLIIEAGGFDGSDTKEFTKLYPNSKILVLEPNPIMFKKLVQLESTNLTVLQNTLVENGLSGQATDFRFSDLSPSSSLLKPIKRSLIPAVNLDKNVKIEGISIVEICRIFDLNQIDLLWLDLQGYEYRIIRDLFENNSEIMNRIKFIQLEVSRIPLYEGAASYGQINSIMIDSGFTSVIKRIPFNSGNVLYRNSVI